MKNLTILLFFVMVTISALSQVNLVTNGDFESYTTCPSGLTQLYQADGWLNVSRHIHYDDPCVSGYFQCTPDYYNTCTTTPSCDVPLNAGGYQIDHSGNNGYAGIIAFSRTTGSCEPGGTDDRWKEYIGCYLTPMQVGDNYRISYYAALSDSSRIYTHLGLVLSHLPIPNTYSTTQITPPLGSFSYNSPTNITNSSDWNLISTDFICNDATRNFLTIGNFTDSVISQVTPFKILLQTTTASAYNNLAYYYIDDVSLYKIDSMPRGHLQQSYSLCNQNYPTLDAGAGSLGTIQWYKDGVVIPAPIGTSRFFTPTSPGVYSFIVTSTTIHAYTYTASTTIYDSPSNVKILPVPFTNCDVNLLLAVTNPQSNLTYSWTVSNVESGNPSSYTGTSFTTILDATALSHTVSLHITDSKSTCTYDTSITIYQCCRRDKLDLYIDATSQQLIGDYPKFYTGVYGISDCQFCRELSFDGTLLINKNLTFKNTAIYMQPYSKIDISSGDTLWLDSCYLTACTNIMWQGINNGTIAWGNGTLIAKNCIIEDAITGITVLNGSFTHCIADTFNKNRKDIVVQPFIGTYNPLQVIKSSFICKDLQLRDYLGFPDPLDNLGLLINPYWALKPHECILLDRVQNVTIGSTCLSCTNYFDNAYTGIHAMNSNVFIYNNEFTNMTPYLTYTGAGIQLDRAYGTAASLTYSAEVGGYLMTQGNHFTNSRYGIISRNITSTIQANTIDNCISGILLDSFYTPMGSTPLTTVVRDNSIKNYTRGIEANFNTRSKIQMLRNSIQGSTPTLLTPVITGIAVNQSIYPSFYEIADNEIYSGRLGISLNNVVQSIIRGNNIRMRSTSSFAIMGISSSNTSRTTFSNNFVVGDKTDGAVVGSAYAYSKAIYFSMSPNDTVYCNKTDTMTWGIEFMGNCLSTNNIAGNIMKRHYDQMTFRSSGFIGAQTSRFFPPLVGSKLMANEFTSSTFLNSNTCAINSFLGSMNYYANNTSPFYPYVNTLVGASSSLIPFATSTSNYKCDPYISSSSGGSTGLMSVEEAGGVEEKQIAEDVIKELIESPIFEESYLLGLKKELFSNLTIDSSLRDSSLIIDSFYLSAMENNIGKLDEIKLAMENETYDVANIKNDAVIPIDNIEINEKKLNEIILNLSQTGYNEEVMDELNSIANQCPISGGKSVFISRSIISSIDLNAFWDDNERCLSGIDFRKLRPTNNESPEITNLTKIKMYPNPASYFINFAIQPNEHGISYIIRDIYGREITSHRIEKEITIYKIDIHNLANGTYYIELKKSDNTYQLLKFNVIN